MNILVTGAKGQLGNELQLLAAQNTSHRFHFHDIDTLNLTDKAAVEKIIDELKPDACINCAAYTAVDKAETEKEICYVVNETASLYLAEACKKQHAILVHVSTDFVFDGTKSTPYVEEDATNPLSVYGASKLAGEEAVRKNNPKHLILRTSWLYSSFGNNFVKTVQRLGKEREALGMIFDQIGTPTAAGDLAKTIVDILPHLNETNFGTYHFSNEGVCSWYDFSVEILKLSHNKTCKISPIETTQYPTPATRPKYSVLNKKKIKNTFSISIPHWTESLEKVINQLSAQ